MNAWLFPGYTFDNVTSSVVGVRISMWVERWLGATSDRHIQGK